MSPSLAGVLQILLLVVVLAIFYKPLGDYIARIFMTKKHLKPELALYRVMGIDPEADQRWGTYARSMLAFSGVCVLFLYLLQRIQHWLPYSNGQSNVSPFLAWNTAASFVTNTNWQNYSGESTMGYVVQMAGLAVQNFVSAGVGIVVVIALIRGFMRNKTDRLGNFWVDLTRVTLRLLIPFAVIGAIILMATGVIDNFNLTHTISTLTGGQQTMVGGPVASQEVIKELGNNGGGFFNANSAHPFENPNPFSNWFEIFLLLVIPFSLPRTFGKMVRDNRQGYILAGVMAFLWLISAGLISLFEWGHAGTALQLAGGAMEGKEVRFGIPGSSLFAASTTVTSTGAVNSFHDSFTPFGGMMALFNMMLGEVVPGGVGAGLYGMLMLAVLTVFVGGLMVGRTPEYIGKKIRPTEMKWAALYILATPGSALIGAALSLGFTVPRRSILNAGPHGLTEIVYAFTSMANNNGSAFAGLTTATGWYNLSGGVVMLVARFAPEIFVLALGGALGRQQPVPASAGTLETHKPLFAGMLIGVIIILVGLTYFPALALGPFAEGLH
jgi:potassium-transporting ATPase potassium-binding subunit